MSAAFLNALFQNHRSSLKIQTSVAAYQVNIACYENGPHLLGNHNGVAILISALQNFPTDVHLAELGSQALFSLFSEGEWLFWSGKIRGVLEVFIVQSFFSTVVIVALDNPSPSQPKTCVSHCEITLWWCCSGAGRCTRPNQTFWPPSRRRSSGLLAKRLSWRRPRTSVWLGALCALSRTSLTTNCSLASLYSFLLRWWRIVRVWILSKF